MSNQTTDYDYIWLSELKHWHEKHEYLNTIRILYFTGFLIICTLGLVLNLFVIIAGSWNHLKSDTAKWVLALAVTHLIFSAFLPLQILYSWYHFNWHYGAILCKVSSYVFYASLFSTAGILSLWTVKGSIERFKCKRKHCLTFKHSTVVLILIQCSWTLAAILSIPSLYSRELRYSDLGEQCIDDYDLNDDTTTEYGKRNQEMVASYRFVLGILIPAFLIAICPCCQRQSMERKCKQITCLIKMAHIVCWTPLLLMVLLQAFSTFDGHPYGLPVATVLATAHCCVNPMIYLLVSHDIKMKWMKQNEMD